MSKLLESLEARRLMAANSVFSLEAGTLTIRHGGVVAITEDANGAWSYTQGSKTYKLSSAEVNSIETVNIANNGTRLDLSGKAADDEDFTVTGKGSINISGVTIVEATPTNQVDANAEIGAIDFANDGGVTVNGTRADYFITLWDEYDDMYGYLSGQPDGANVLNGAGQNGYNNTNPLPQPVVGETTLGPAALAVNRGFLDLGIEYIAYLEAGNVALTTFTAKANAPGRDQSIHDNLLSNLNREQLWFRNLPGLGHDYVAIDAFVPGDWETRASYNGFAATDGADLQASVQFDFDHDVNRTDYALYGL